jgi:hypothetical protein
MHCKEGHAEHLRISAWVTRGAGPPPLPIGCGLRQALPVPDFHSALLALCVGLAAWACAAGRAQRERALCGGACNGRVWSGRAS